MSFPSSCVGVTRTSGLWRECKRPDQLPFRETARAWSPLHPRDGSTNNTSTGHTPAVPHASSPTRAFPATPSPTHTLRILPQPSGLSSCRVDLRLASHHHESDLVLGVTVQLAVKDDVDRVRLSC